MATALLLENIDELDVFDFVVNQGNGVKALSDLSLETVPANYILPVEERLGELNTKFKNNDLEIPIIDVSNWEDSQELICDAARKWGFFQIINHGVPSEVLDNVLEATHRFFGLPEDEKKEYFFRAPNSGDTCRLKTSFMPHKEEVMEWKDHLVHYVCCTQNGIKQRQGLELPKGFSRWPPVSRDEVLEYIKCTSPVIKKLLEALMKGLNVDKIEEGTEDALMGTLIANLNYYPKCPNPDLTYGIAPHTDVTTITILLQDETGGLYVRVRNEDIWIPVKPVKGALVINIGDMLQIMSNDKYHSIEHRASASIGTHRVSVPIFVKPAPDAVVKTLDEVLEIGEKSKYKPVVYSDYFKYFLSKPHDGRKTIEYAKI